MKNIPLADVDVTVVQWPNGTTGVYVHTPGIVARQVIFDADENVNNTHTLPMPDDEKKFDEGEGAYYSEDFVVGASINER